MMFKEIIAVYSENYAKPIRVNTNELLTDKAGGSYSYHSALKGYCAVKSIIC
jgi:hypothetical protein